MCVPGGGLDLSVPQEFSDHGKALTERHRSRREAVAEIMDADTVESGTRPDPAPGMLKIGQVRTRFLSGNDPGVARIAGEASEEADSGRCERNDPRAGFGLRWMEYRPNPPYYMKKN